MESSLNYVIILLLLNRLHNMQYMSLHPTEFAMFNVVGLCTHDIKMACTSHLSRGLSCVLYTLIPRKNLYVYERSHQLLPVSEHFHIQ